MKRPEFITTYEKLAAGGLNESVRNASQALDEEFEPESVEGQMDKEHDVE